MSTYLGATYQGKGRCRFLVWAPNAAKVEVLLGDARSEGVSLQEGEHGYYEAVTAAVPGTRYCYLLNGKKERPDPASRFQPEGVHGPSEIVDPQFDWSDGEWQGIELEDYIIYEIHVGTFTPQGTFAAAIDYLDGLKSLGITAIEIMPVAQFPGNRNWGYDGACPFAVQNCYGGPRGLKLFVNACHNRGLAVILDVVYNHLGPEGNYLSDFGPYFTNEHRTPWGDAINYDGAHSDEVRRFFIENALYWISEFHIDALRLDAVHAIFDNSAFPFLEELGLAVHAAAERLQRKIYVVPESDLNDPRLVTNCESGGFGLDAQWSDDFHHALHTLLTGETTGYYADFGSLRDLAKAYREGYVYSGQYSVHRQRRHGRPPNHVAAKQLVVCAQNHDQVGNRMQGERLSCLVEFAGLKLAAGAVMLSPFIPLLFMGEEYGETAPFQYFVSHSDPAVIAATRKGRREEFASFGWQGEVPDPQDEATFMRSKIDHQLACRPSNHTLQEFYRDLIRLRRHYTSLRCLSMENLEVRTWEAQKVLLLRRWSGESQTCVFFNFSHVLADIEVSLTCPTWFKVLDSAERCWNGEGTEVSGELQAGTVCLKLAPQSLVMFAAV